MKHLKSFQNFNEGAACGSGDIGGMGSVVSSQPGYLPGTFGTTGSGDVGFPLLYGKSKRRKRRRKMGNPSQVSDMRFLAPVKINKVKEGLTDIFIKDTEENRIAKEIISKIDSLDPENISYEEPIYSFILNHKVIQVEIEEGIGWPMKTSPDTFKIRVDDNKIDCSYILSRNIWKEISKMYKDEQKRQKSQNLGQILV